MRTRRLPVPLLIVLLLAPAVLLPGPARAAGIPIDGRAVGLDSREIAGARAELRPILSRYEQGVRDALGQGPPEPAARAVTGADGRFTLTAPRQGMWEVTVTAAGYGPATARLLPLREEASLADMVLRRDAGLPVPAAHPPRGKPRRILVQEADGGLPPGVVVRDPVSLLVLGQIPPGRKRAIVPAAAGSFLLLETADGRRMMTAMTMTVPAGGASPVLRVRLPRPAVRSGLVLDAVTHRPLAGALVWTCRASIRDAACPEMLESDPALFPPSAWDDEPDHTETEEDGSFILRDLSPGRFRLFIARPHAAPFVQEGIEIGPAGATTDLGRIVLPDGATLAGRIHDPAGRPLAGARVRVRTQGNGWNRNAQFDAVTDEDGTFAFAGIPPHGSLILSACRAGAAGATINLQEAPPEPLDLVLRPAAGIAGRVLGADGAPLAGASASVLREPRAWGGGICMVSLPRPCDPKDRGQSDAEGRFALSRLTPGAYTLQVRASGFAVAEVKGLRVHAGEEIDGIEVRLAPAGPEKRAADQGDNKPDDPEHEVRGRVVGPDGAPVAGALVESLGGFFPSEAGGAFTVFLPAEGGRLTATAHGYAPGHTAVTAAPANGIEIRLEDEATVSGTIRGPSAREMAWVQVSADRADGRSPGAVAADGTYRILHLSPGKAVIAAGTASAFVKRKLEIPRGQREVTLDLDLDIPPVSEVHGRVTGPGREPVPGALVRARRKDGSIHEAFAAGDGTFVLRLEDGTWPVDAEADGYTKGSLELEAPDAGMVEIRMERATVLHGQLPGLAADEIPSIQAAGPSGNRSGEADPDGGYLVAGLEPGTWTVTGSLHLEGTRDGYRTATGRVTVHPGGGEAFLDLDFAIGNLTLTVRAPAGGTILAADLLRPDGTVFLSAGHSPVPAVRFDRLRPGAYRLRWTQLNNLQSGEQEAILTADREITLESETPGGPR